MAILKNILEESLAYYQDLERRYLKRLAELPRGSLLKRRLAGHDYFYLIYREGRRVVSKYLGKADPVKVRKEVAERRQLKQQLKEARENLRLLRRLSRPRKHGKPLSKNP